MELGFSEEQHAIRELAKRVFSGMVTPDRLREVDADPERFDRALWAELARTQLLGVGIDAAFGGIGGGMLEAASLLEELGNAVPRVPLLGHCVAAITIATCADSREQQKWCPGIAKGDLVFTVALSEPGSDDVTRPQAEASHDASTGTWTLSGSKTAVPYAGTASRALTTAVTPEGPRLFHFDATNASIALEDQRGTSGEPQARLTLRSTPAEQIGDESAVATFHRVAVVAICAVQTGLAERALALTAEHVKLREQFERPLGTFQAVQQRIADAYIDVEAMRWTMWQAAWMLDEGLPADEEVTIAKYWAADGGHRVLAAAQHLHGGLGVDADYPLHRYTTTAKQLEMTMGGASRQLARLGDLIATGARR